MQWREITPPVETLRLSWLYLPRLSTTPTIVAHSIIYEQTESSCMLEASASTETVFAGTGVFQPCHQSSLLPLGSILDGHRTSNLGRATFFE